ncbi:MAG: NAD-dependent epimerase/dehydratase family protein [Pelagibacteraceae bacterium]
MKQIDIFCFGFGQVAKNFIKKLRLENLKVNLSVTSRKISKQEKFEGLTYNNFQLDKNFFDQSLLDKLENSKYILISIPPLEGEDVVIRNFEKFLDNKNLKWITYLSATSVYGDHKGNWVNEESDTNPTSKNGIDRLAIEKSWLNLAKSKNLPLQIFRLSGIYSDQRNILSRLKLGQEKIIDKKNHFFSRIHIDDIANILFNSLKKFKTEEIYNISDDKPASSKELILYGSQILGIEKPETVSVNSIENEMLKNFYKDSKKVSNKKMKNYFKYNLKYPTYIEGLNNIFNK